MRKIVLSAFAGVTAMGCLGGASLADSIVATARVDGVLVATENSADGNLNVSSQSFGPLFNLNSLSINTESFLAPPGLMSTNTLDVGQNLSGIHQLVIDIVGLGLVGPGAIESLLSSFSVSGMTAGWSAREQTFINNGLLADTGTFSNPSDSAFSVNPALVTNPFNAEVKYTINSVGIGQFNGGIDISAAPVPGPVAGAGLPGLLGIMALAALGSFRRKLA